MPPAAQAQTQPPPQRPPQQPQDDDRLTALIVAALAAYWTAQTLTRALRAPFKAAGISGAALSATAALVASWPHEAMEGTGPAQRWALRANLQRRASFFLHAARRTQQAIVTARSKDQPVMAAIRDALTAERRFMAQHIQASTGRVQAATAVDGAAAMYGNLLSWNAVIDPRCTPECRAADGKSFYADRPPKIGYPGSTHPNCRCFPGPPRPGATVLP
jgi:SPP1 gp7 family putative phage head morphogenesis protein